ncbi:hypothetical protein IGK74_002451 [Enterococcus sp. AZ150]
MSKKKEEKSIRKEQSKERDRIKELEKQVCSLQIENGIEEAAKTGSSTKTTESIARIIDSLRGSFELVELLDETLNFPKFTFMYWQKRFNRQNPD